MFAIHFDSRKINQRISRGERYLRNMRGTWAQVGRIIKRSSMANFKAGGRPAWPKRKDDKPHPLLILSGKLKGSIRSVPHHDGVDVGSSVKYAATHQYGRDNIPARPYLRLMSGEVETARKIIDRGLKRAFK